MSISVEKTTFHSLLIQHMSSITKDTHERLKQAKKYEQGDSLKFLDAGIWYCSDYYEGLKKCKQNTRLEFLKKKDAFFHGYVGSKLLEAVKDMKSHSGYQTKTFKVENDTKPSVALDEFGKSLSLLECQTVCYLAVARAIRDYITVEKFDCLFASGFTLAPNSNFSLKGLMDTHALSHKNKLKPGDICYIDTIPDYFLKHPLGNGGGFNLMYLSSDKYLGFGLPSEGCSETEVVKELLDSYNKDPVSQQMCRDDLWEKVTAQEYKITDTIKTAKQYALNAKKKITKVIFDGSEPAASKVPELAPIAAKVKAINENWQTHQDKFCMLIVRVNVAALDEIAKAPLNQVKEIFKKYEKPLFYYS